MECKLDVIIITKTKENDLLLRIVRIRWQNTLNTVTNILREVSVPTKDGSQCKWWKKGRK
jgi:hypothetical protein